MIVTNGLVGYWHFQQGVNGNSWNNIAPATLGKYNGSISGATLQGNGLYFDGVDDFVGYQPLSQSGISVAYEIEAYISSPFDRGGINGGVAGSLHFDGATGLMQFMILGFNGNGTAVTTAFKEENITPLRNTLIKVNYIANIEGKIEEVYINNVKILEFYNTMSMMYVLANISQRPFALGCVLDTFSGGNSNHYKGHIQSVKIYNKILTSQERSQNLANGIEIGLTVQISKPIINISSVSKTKISDEPDMNQSIIKVSFDQDIVEYIAKLNGVDHTTGETVHIGGAVLKNQEADVIIDWDELTVEGQNRINIYGKNSNGDWTEYSN